MPMLYLIGTGLTAKSISVDAVEISRACKKVYLENYTCRMQEDLAALEKVCGVSISIASRNFLEKTDSIVQEALHDEIALFVMGSPLFATTHTDILIRAKERGVKVRILHNASIMSVMGCCGLYSYSFGRTVSVPFFAPRWRPTSFYRNINENIKANLHTLCLLDICVDESGEKYMSANVALEQLVECEAIEGLGIIRDNTEAFVVCRFGSASEEVVFGTVYALRNRDFGGPLHSLIIPARMDTVEREHVAALCPRCDTT